MILSLLVYISLNLGMDICNLVAIIICSY